MKKLVLLGMLLSPPLASASDASAAFKLNEGIVFAGNTLTGLELDVTIHTRYIAVNGAFKAGGLGVPTSGTCQTNSAGGVFCLLQSGHISFILDLTKNLSGTVRMADEFGNVNAVSSVSLSELF